MKLNLIVRYLPSNASLTLCCVGKLGWQPQWKPVSWVTEVINREPHLNSTNILRQDWPSPLPASHNSVSSVKYSTVKSPESHPQPCSITWTQMSRHCVLPGAPSLKPTVCVVSLEMKHHQNENVLTPTVGHTAEILQVSDTLRMYELIKYLTVTNVFQR